MHNVQGKTSRVVLSGPLLRRVNILTVFNEGVCTTIELLYICILFFIISYLHLYIVDL